MLGALYAGLSDVAVVIISLAAMMLGGFLMTRLTKRLRLPNVTAYILAGVLLGPYCLDVVPARVVEGTAFLSDVALAFIAFGVGQFFRLSTLRRSGAKVVVITLFEALLASVLVFILTFFILRIDLGFSVVLAALASATAPASTMMTIRQTKAHGDFVDTLLEVVALDDVVSLLAYSVAISVALSTAGGAGNADFSAVIFPVLKNLAAILLGGVFGLLLAGLIKKRSTDNRLIVTVCFLFLFCGIAAAMDVSPLLGCMVIGSVYVNVTDDDKLFLQVNYFNPPILLLFFVRSGVGFDLNALVSGGSVGSVPLWVIGLTYFFVRILGKYGGAWLGSLTVKKDKPVRRYLGLALIPQAGVAIGLAELGARTLGGEAGVALSTVILASSVLYELVGPAVAKLALYLSGSYSEKLEDVAVVAEKTKDGKAKSDVEILIERIKKIREEVAPLYEKADAAEESAFTEAAEQQMEEQETPFRYRRGIVRRK